MRKVFLLALFVLAGSVARAGNLVVEAPCRSVGTAVTVSVSTSAWTKVPTSNLSGRSGIIVSNPDSNTADIVAVLSASAVTPTEATTVRPIAIVDGNGFGFIPAADNLYLYALSLHTSAESLHAQDCKQ